MTKDKEKYYWSCENYPKCKKTVSFYNNQLLKSKCESCGSQLIIKYGYHGAFIGCSNFPKCKFTKDLPFSEFINKDNYKINNYQKTKLE